MTGWRVVLVLCSAGLASATWGCSAGGLHASTGVAGSGGGGSGGAAGNLGPPVDAGPPPGASCSDAGPPRDAGVALPPDYADGTRLEALSYVTDDCTRLQHGWRDTQRAETCTFMLAEDGQVRCLPAFEGTSYFTDAACTQPLLARPACGDTPPVYVSAGPVDTCPGARVPALHKRLDPMAAPAAVFVLDSMGACTRGGLPPGQELWQGAAVPEPPTAFVAAVEIHQARGPALMARYYQAEDGALQLLGAFDVAAQRACAEVRWARGVCAPDPLTIVAEALDEFGDAACTVPTILVFPTCGSKPLDDIILLSFGGTSCEAPTADPFYKLGAPYPDRPFLKNYGGTMCAQSVGAKVYPPSPNRRFLGDKLPPSAFPEVQTVDEGTGRFRVRTLEAPDGQHLATTKILDTVQGGTCTPTPIAGVLRCLPDEELVSGFYADAACTQPLHVKPPECATPKLLLGRAPVTCGARRPGEPARLFEVGPVVTTETIFYGGNTGGCVMLPVAGLGEVRTLTERPLSAAPAIAGQ